MNSNGFREEISSAETSSTRAVRVLLVEDDPEYARLIQRVLGASDPDIEIRHQETLGSALLAQMEDPADVVLLDLGLPDSTAENTTTSATRMLARSAPVFVLTGSADHASVERALEAGVEDYFVKSEIRPLSLARLLRTAAERFSEPLQDRDPLLMSAPEFREEVRNRIARSDSSSVFSVTLIHIAHFDEFRARFGEARARRVKRMAISQLQDQAPQGSLLAELGEGLLALLTDGPAQPARYTLDLENGVEMQIDGPDVGVRQGPIALQGSVASPSDGTHPASLIALALERALAQLPTSPHGGGQLEVGLAS